MSLTAHTATLFIKFLITLFPLKNRFLPNLCKDSNSSEYRHYLTYVSVPLRKVYVTRILGMSEFDPLPTKHTHKYNFIYLLFPHMYVFTVNPITVYRDIEQSVLVPSPK